VPRHSREPEARRERERNDRKYDENAFDRALGSLVSFQFVFYAIILATLLLTIGRLYFMGTSPGFGAKPTSSGPSPPPLTVR